MTKNIEIQKTITDNNCYYFNLPQFPKNHNLKNTNQGTMHIVPMKIIESYLLKFFFQI